MERTSSFKIQGEKLGVSVAIGVWTRTLQCNGSDLSIMTRNVLGGTAADAPIFPESEGK